MDIPCRQCTRRAVKLAPINLARSERAPYCRDHGPAQGTPVPNVNPSMLKALRLVWEVAGSTKLAIVKQLTDEANRAWGYRVIEQAIEADLILARKARRGYALFPTRLGAAILGQGPLAA